MRNDEGVDNMTASKQTLRTAIAEAKRFIERADFAIKDIESLDRQRNEGVTYPHCGNINSAAAKRASMDLTRALVHVRR